MNIATIGFKGGCNPIPIDYKVSNGTLTVPDLGARGLGLCLREVGG